MLLPLPTCFIAHHPKQLPSAVQHWERGGAELLRSRLERAMLPPEAPGRVLHLFQLQRLQASLHWCPHPSCLCLHCHMTSLCLCLLFCLLQGYPSLDSGPPSSRRSTSQKSIPSLHLERPFFKKKKFTFTGSNIWWFGHVFGGGGGWGHNSIQSTLTTNSCFRLLWKSYV